MGGAFKNARKIKTVNAHEKVKEGTSRADATTNLCNFLSRIFSVPTEQAKTKLFYRGTPQVIPKVIHTQSLQFRQLWVLLRICNGSMPVRMEQRAYAINN